ncbi:hypothetical protein HMSSN036_49090 [Paenibacillus macerans]|nr:hypothetical protein HMSSN036_49090 [Paenibacillus macerans]
MLGFRDYGKMAVCYYRMTRRWEELFLKYKLLALDMDGTLLNDEQQITPETEKWIRKAAAAGVHVCLSTGGDIMRRSRMGSSLIWARR